MNQKNQTHCTSCNVFDWCFLICCPIANLCNQCVLDPDIFDEYYVCPNCDRPIGRMYRNMVDEAQICLQDVNMRGNACFNTYGNANSKMARTNSFTSLNVNCNQIQQQEEEFQFVHKSRPFQQQTNLKRNNFNQYSNTTNMNMSMQQNRNNFTRQQGNTFNGGINQQNNMSRNQGKINLRNIIGINQGQPNMNNFNGKINNFNGPMNNFSNNGMMYNNNSCYNNYNNNYQQQQNNFNMNQQFNQSQCQQTNKFTTNIRKTKQSQQEIQSQEFFFQDQIQQQQKFRTRRDTITGNNSVKKNNFNFISNQTGNHQQINNPFNQQNNNFIQNNRTNKNIHLNNFNQSNKKINGQNHSFDQEDQFFFNDQRMVKSATKLRRNDFSPNNFKRNNFKAIESGSFSNQNGLIDDRNRNSEKDLSPTFGQGDIKERENFEFQGRGEMIPQEKSETMNLRKSGSSYTLG